MLNGKKTDIYLKIIQISPSAPFLHTKPIRVKLLAYHLIIPQVSLL